MIETHVDGHTLGILHLLSVELTLGTDMFKVCLLLSKPIRLQVIGAVDSAQNQVIVFLAFPAQIGHRLAADNVWAKLAPDLLKRAQLGYSVTCIGITLI